MPLRAPRGFVETNSPRVSAIGHAAPAWLMNYADLMTEMVAFFVILYALGAALNKDVQKAKESVEQIMKEENIAGKVEMTKDGLSITMVEGSKEGEDLPFFESGKAELTPRMIKILQMLSPKLKELAGKGHDVNVEGHTDNVPISSAYFKSNWELSTERATVVVRYLIDQTQFLPNKLGAVGYGEHRPVAPNDTPENRMRNRRVVFFVRNVHQTFVPESKTKEH